MESEFHYRRHKSQQINSVTLVLLLPSHISPGALSILPNSDFYIKDIGILHFTVPSTRRRTHTHTQ